MSSPLKQSHYDIIVCGGGTAGCVLASRLTEDPNISVLMLEAGQDANEDFRISTPGLFTLAIDNPDLDWRFMAEASPGLNGRKMALPRGKCIGGSSAINLMALVYPSKAGLDAWAELGNPDWDFEGMRPYYRRFQRCCPPSDEIRRELGIDFLDPQVQGTDGPIASSYPPALDPLQKAWVDTWKGLKKEITGDPMLGVHSGGYTSPASIDPETAERSHAGVEYYGRRAKGRANLDVVTGALIERVEFDARDPDAVRATGVTFTHTVTGERYTVHADREVLLTAGVIGSPSILERSGIGSKSLLSTLGIEPIIDNPGVGENLQDHLMCGASFEVRDGVLTTDMIRDPAIIEAGMHQYQTSRTGHLAAGGGYALAYTPPTSLLTPAQNATNSTTLSDLLAANPPKNKIESVTQALLPVSPPSSCMIPLQFAGHLLSPSDLFAIHERENYITILPQLAHPLSRGSVHITSSSAHEHPKIDPRYFSNEVDVHLLAGAMMQIETFASSPPLCHFLKPPGEGRRLPDVYDASTLDRAKDFVRANATSNYHPVGTCAMMSRDLGGVLDTKLKVYGTRNLRVCDASVFPIQVRGNVQTTVYAVAEKGADVIKTELELKLKR